MIKFTYLFIDLGALIIPLIFSFHPKLRFHKEWRYFFPALFIGAGIFIAWDVYFTDLKVWGFNEKYLIGVSIFNLPLEEILFFICIPYACVFTYHCLQLFFDFTWNKKISDSFTIILITALTIIGIIHFDQSYTSVTFISLALLIGVIRFLFNYSLDKIFSTYFFLLIPFMIVNGLLTGTGLDEPIVWYNNHENLAIRLLTIPVEDIFYGFEFFLLITFIYLKFKSKNA